MKKPPPFQQLSRAFMLGATSAIVLFGGLSAQPQSTMKQNSVGPAPLAQASSTSAPPNASPAPKMTYEDYRAETFIASQNAIISDASDALNQVSARFAQGRDEVSVLTNRREDIAKELSTVSGRIEDMFKRPIPTDAARAATIRAEIDALQAQSEALTQRLRAANDEINEKFPAFAELTRPQALNYRQVQALLAPDEALIVFVTADDATYSWAVTRDGFDWARSENAKLQTLTQNVSKLRTGLQTTPESRGGIGSRTTQNERARTQQTQTAPANTAPVFDRALAHQMYLDLIAPLDRVISGKRLVMAVTNGPLASLPLQVLVTRPPSGNDRDQSAVAATQWLADKYVLSTLPTVSSLRALRCYLVRAGGPRNAGCPAATQASAGEVRQGISASNRIAFTGFGAPVLSGTEAANRGAPQFQNAFEDKLADPDVLRRLPSLPGTAIELNGVASQFGRGGHVFLASQATETAVRTSTLLPRARYVVFATHGLLAGQSGVAGEPGLVFTPPLKANRTEMDDGLLTASEAAQLRLSADFVVLSACNTASADGRLGGDGLSGLARAFFYAGAPAVLASHWEVSDSATAQLMMDTFANLDRRDVRGRGEALQKAQAKLRQNGRPEWVHPNYWAAFTLAGEAN
jgi:CHAT domain-containing protein